MSGHEVSRRNHPGPTRIGAGWLRSVQIFGTLIGDEQQVYDLSYLDDQLVLGIKGTLSVVELKVLRQRMQAGQESKARRGELFKRLPIGYIKDAAGKVVLHSDRRVVDAVRLVFTKFRELWSVRQTFQWFRDHDVELPANPIRGTGRLVWKGSTSQSLVRDVLRNPFYAGAYVWGRRPVETLLIEGRLRKRQAANRRPEDCRVFIAGHHPGYIDWATYPGENQRMTHRNSVNWQADESLPAIRAGQGLLVGLLRCGHCGRKLHVRYWGGTGTNARYLCKGDFDDGGQRSHCIGFWQRCHRGSPVQSGVAKGYIARWCGSASLKAIDELSSEMLRSAPPWRISLSGWSTKRSGHSNNMTWSTPETVSRPLNWNAAGMKNWKRSRPPGNNSLASKAKGIPLSAEEEAEILSMGENFADVWHGDRCPPTLKKMIFRTAIEEIIVRTDVRKETLHFTIHWKGGAHTQLEMDRPRIGN